MLLRVAVLVTWLSSLFTVCVGSVVTAWFFTVKKVFSISFSNLTFFRDIAVRECQYTELELDDEFIAY